MNFEYSYSAGSDLAGFLTAYLVLWLVLIGLSIVSYILSSLGMYTIANRRELSNPWMAWVPLLRSWLLGSISDQYQYVTQGKVCNKRKWLIALEIAQVAGVILTCVLMIVMMVQTVMDSSAGIPEHEQMEAIMTMTLVYMLGGLLSFGIAISAQVIRYVALYDLFKSCTPGNAVLFLVLSILLGVPEAFFIFFNRKKDGGMPPRRPQPYHYIPQQPGYPPQTPGYPPQTPVYQPQTPVYQPQTPAYPSEPSVCLPQEPAAEQESSVCLPQEPVAEQESSVCLPQEPVAETEASVCLPQEPVAETEASVCLPQEPVAETEPSVCLPQEPVEEPRLPVIRLEPMNFDEPVGAGEPTIPLAEPVEPEVPSGEEA